MGGAILNMVTVALGSLIGLLVGNRFPQKIQESVVTGLGLVTLVVGIGNAQKTGNIIIPLLSIAIGVILGELLNVQLGLERLAGWLQKRVMGQSASETSNIPSGETSSAPDPRTRFITGFVTASLVFCIGPLTFVGSIQDGMGLAIGFQQIAIKSVLDFFEVLAAPREIARLLLMLQREHGERASGLTDVDAMIVQAHGAADDAAEAHIALRTDEAAHFHRDEAAQREDAALAELMDVASRLAIVRPWAGVACAFQIGAAGVVKVVVKLPREDTIGIHRRGKGLLRSFGSLAHEAVLLTHHVECL